MKSVVVALAVAVLAATLLGGRSVASAQTTASTAQCDDGDPSAIGATCTTSDGGAGSCLAEMCEVVDEGGTSLGPCALCYAPADAPPGDGGAIVVIATTTTTSSDDGGACGLAGRGGGVDGVPTSLVAAGALAVLLAARRRRSRGVPRCAKRDRSDGAAI